MMKLQYALVLLFVTMFFAANAQLRYGFKTGLSIAHFTGPSEVDDAGTDLETWKNVTGFHIGATFTYKFTDNFGLRGELLYSKKGAKYTFDGQSYRVFRYDGGSTLSYGSSRYLVNINNSYLDIPVLGVARWGDFEFSAGGYVGFLIGSVGDGSLRYSGKTAPPQQFQIKDKETNNEELVFNLNYNYRKDDPGAGEGAAKVIAELGTRDVELPKTLGAYFDYTEDRGKVFNGLDYGLIGGFSYYLSSTLYAGIRLQYGLADVTNNTADLSKARINADGTSIYRDDKDKNFAVQVSVGFSF
ncbi:MAG: PorT family protein [Lewinellaceae bacterium]|nr:PorT family protein [Lewinellaceae bacterium]